MKQITDFLKKFSTLKPVKRKIIEGTLVIAEKQKLPLTKEMIDVRGDCIFITTNSVIKNELFIKKEIFISEINSFLGKDSIKDIR